MSNRLYPVLALLVAGLVLSSAGLGWFVARAVMSPARPIAWMSLGLAMAVAGLSVAQIFVVFGEGLPKQTRGKAIDGR